jgi:catechol 2,3-dioxygenase-like lactoylglutathione lyase family enzyme
MRIHHLALLTEDPARLARDYADTFGLPIAREHTDAQGVRAVWFDLGGTLLMIERGARQGKPGQCRGLDGLFLAAEPGSGPAWAARLGDRVTGRTAYTLYATDADGNRVGVSSYPHALG